MSAMLRSQHPWMQAYFQGKRATCLARCARDDGSLSRGNTRPLCPSRRLHPCRARGWFCVRLLAEQRRRRCATTVYTRPLRKLGFGAAHRDRPSCSTASASAKSRASSSIPRHPRQVLATIAIDRTTPVRADTFVTIDFQGLTGSPVIALVGGSSKQPLAASQIGRPAPHCRRCCRAEHVGRRARRRCGGLTASWPRTPKPLRTMIANLDTFAGALARNSDKLDGIVAGLERMTGGAARHGADLRPRRPARCHHSRKP